MGMGQSSTTFLPFVQVGLAPEEASRLQVLLGMAECQNKAQCPRRTPNSSAPSRDSNPLGAQTRRHPAVVIPHIGPTTCGDLIIRLADSGSLEFNSVC